LLAVSPMLKFHFQAIYICFILVSLAITAKVTVSDGTLIISSRAVKEGSTLHRFDFQQGKKLTQTVEVQGDHHLFLNFKLKNAANGRSVLAQQSMVKFTNLATRVSVYLVVSPVSTAYQLHLDATKAGSLFDFVSGTYSLELIVGDNLIDTAIRTQIAEVSFHFSGQPTLSQTVDSFSALPLIAHQFRADVVHAPALTSTFFTAAVLAPFLFLLGGFQRVGANLGGLSSSGLFGPLFILCIAAMFGLIVYFWWALKLYQAAALFAVLCVPTFVCGNQVLASLAKTRMAKTKTD